MWKSRKTTKFDRPNLAGLPTNLDFFFSFFFFFTVFVRIYSKMRQKYYIIFTTSILLFLQELVCRIAAWKIL